MATAGESSSSTVNAASDRPVIVRVKRKVAQSPLGAFWLEINERPLKRPLLDFEKLSICDSKKEEELKTKKILVQHVETVTSSESTIDFVQTFVSTSAGSFDCRTKSGERRHTFKKDNRQDQLLSKSRQEQQAAAKDARFEQIWRSRRGKEDGIHKLCHFYDVVRIDGDEEPKNVPPPQEHTSLEEQRMLASYLPLLREVIPNAVEQIESDICDYMSKQAEKYVYDYYTVKDEMNIDDGEALHPFPLVKVEDEDFYDGPTDSEYDSEDSNAEDNPRNDYPDEMSEEEEDEKEEESVEGDDGEDENDEERQSEGLDESEDDTFWHSSSARRNVKYEDDFYDDFDSDDYGLGYSDEDYRRPRATDQ